MKTPKQPASKLNPTDIKKYQLWELEHLYGIEVVWNPDYISLRTETKFVAFKPPKNNRHYLTELERNLKKLLQL